MDSHSSPVKQEKTDFLESDNEKTNTNDVSIRDALTIEISSSSNSSSSSSDDDDANDLDRECSELLAQLRSKWSRKRVLIDPEVESLLSKKPKTSDSIFVLPPGFLSLLPKNQVHAPTPLNFVPPDTQPQPAVETEAEAEATPAAEPESQVLVVKSCKQFWKAGNYEGGNSSESSNSHVGMDHLRVHPKFLHSNATSHIWVLGAFAELLDNSLDEACNGATYVSVDTLKNMKDGSHMLVVEDNGGGMTPDKMRLCMSLGYSVKSKMTNTIGQYGNGFKTSTMRLGADVIVFSRCQGNDAESATQSIGMLSYTFLRGTGKEDIVVPMVDYEKKGESWNKMTRSSSDDWNRNLDTIVQWSPYTSEKDLIQQFDFLKKQGTRIVIYNLWEDDEGNSELDFDYQQDDIQIRGVNRDEKNISMARQYPYCMHFLTYRHSLRVYASILYLRLPPDFTIILRGKDVEHHNLVNDLMLTKELTYKPVHLSDGVLNSDMVATVTLGFVKDIARAHIDIQGFNIYHKNRLIKPFWRLWNAAGSDGRGIIGVLEANFVEPAHDKQSFERTPVLSRLENRLVKFQKEYWGNNCQEVGYAPRRNSKKPVSPKSDSRTSSSKMKSSAKFYMRSPAPAAGDENQDGSSHEESPAFNETEQDNVATARSPRMTRMSRSRAVVAIGDGQVVSDGGDTYGRNTQTTRVTLSMAAAIDGAGQVLSSADTQNLTTEPREEPLETRGRNRGPTRDDLIKDLQNERDRSKSLENQLREVQEQLKKAQRETEELNQEQLALIDILQEERERRELMEESLRKRLSEASNTIGELVDKVKQLEGNGD